jgi:hypothetical protein
METSGVAPRTRSPGSQRPLACGLPVTEARCGRGAGLGSSWRGPKCRRPARGPAGRRPGLHTGTVAAQVRCTCSSHWLQCQPAGPGGARAPSLIARTHAARTRARTRTGAGIQGCLGPRAMAMCVLCAHGSSTLARTTRAHAGPHDAEATRPDAARFHAVDGRHANPVCTRNWAMQRTAFNAHKAGSVEE